LQEGDAAIAMLYYIQALFLQLHSSCLCPSLLFKNDTFFFSQYDLIQKAFPLKTVTSGLASFDPEKWVSAICDFVGVWPMPLAFHCTGT
jgi:hypothetical protein